ncbi:hypothetical protein PT974_00660 [Cladobotryum mycophilum]|uniref:Uncharacterized protein n=1 Tax=Cladobotryum mycophilum TaxID=491253 RepID=A0ABR0T2R5_9HYPO
MRVVHLMIRGFGCRGMERVRRVLDERKQNSVLEGVAIVEEQGRTTAERS